MYKHYFISMAFIITASLTAVAQTSIHATWQHNEVVAMNRQSFSNELHLGNSSGKPVTLHLFMETGGSVFYSKKIPDTATLQPGEKKTLVVEAVRLNTTGDPLVLRTIITSTPGNETTASFILLPEQMRTPVKVVFDNQQRYFSSANDTISIPVKIQNFSSRKQAFSYHIKDEAKGLGYILEDMNPWLEAYESKIFLLKIFRNGQFKDFLSYQMQFEMFDAQKNPVLQSFIPVQSISSYYRMSNPSAIGQGELLVEYRSLKDIYQVSDIRYADKIQLGDGNISFQLRHQYYFMQRNSQLFNSYLQWNAAWGAVRLGEIYTTGELSSYGNGFYLKFRQKNRQHELWGTLNTGLLYSSVPVFSRNKKTFGYTFTQTADKTVNLFQAGYVDDVNTGEYGILVHARQYRNLRGGRIEAGGGWSTGFSKFGTKSTASLAAELLYRQQLGKWQFESNNRFTGRHYLGQNRGQHSLFNKVTHTFTKEKQISVGQYWQNNHPEYYISFTPRQYTYHRLFVEYARTRPSLYQSVKLQYQDEALGNFYFSGATRLYSMILGYQVNWQNRNSHQFAFSAETAIQDIRNASEPKKFTAIRLKTSWRHKNFSSRISWQSAVFNINSYSIFRPEGYLQAEWLTQYRISSPGTRFSGNIQFGLYKEDFYDGLRSKIAVDMNYRYSSTLTLNAGVTKLANFFWQQPEYKIGMVYKPGWMRSSASRNLRVKLFHDMNNNGVKDKDENWAIRTNLLVAGRTMQTDDNGSVHVNQIPRGEHMVTAKGINHRISVTKNSELNIPLNVQYKISGNLIVQNDSSQRANRILYFTQAGGAEFVAVTASNGSFTLTLPRGRYLVTAAGLENLKLPGIKGKSITLEKETADIEIVAEAKTRKISRELLTMQ